MGKLTLTPTTSHETSWWAWEIVYDQQVHQIDLPLHLDSNSIVTISRYLLWWISRHCRCVMNLKEYVISSLFIFLGIKSMGCDLTFNALGYRTSNLGRWDHSQHSTGMTSSNFFIPLLSISLFVVFVNIVFRVAVHYLTKLDKLSYIKICINSGLLLLLSCTEHDKCG